MNYLGVKDKARIRIGSRLYSVFVDEKPQPGSHVYSVETYGNPHPEYQQKFHIDDLIGLFSRDLPVSFSLSAYEPRLRVQCIDMLWVNKRDGRCELVLMFNHYFKDWHFPQNLHHFYNDVCGALLDNPPYPSEISLSKDEYGLSASMKSQVNDHDDIATHIIKLSSYIGKVIEDQILSLQLNARGQKFVAPGVRLKPDEDGWKWWVRYVFVPLGVASVGVLLALALRFVT